MTNHDHPTDPDPLAGVDIGDDDLRLISRGGIGPEHLPTEALALAAQGAFRRLEHRQRTSLEDETLWRALAVASGEIVDRIDTEAVDLP